MNRRLLAWAGVAAGPTFLACATITGLRRPDYSALRHPISCLELGQGGWVQRANFWFAGTLYLGAATVLPRGSIRQVGHATTGAGLLLAGAFVADPVSGYPPGADATPTPVGMLHDASAIPVFLGVPVLQLLQSARYAQAGERRWAAHSALSAAVTVTGVAGSAAGFAQSPRWVPYGGLFQRVAVVGALGWLSAQAWPRRS